MSNTFYACGRVEIGGNHTDHQHGSVLAAAVDITMNAEAVAVNGDMIRVNCGEQGVFNVDIRCLAAREYEKGTTAALIRGVAAGFACLGYRVGGFDATVESQVGVGSGLSSSAAFEVLIARIINKLYCGNAVSDNDIAKIGQNAENIYFGKPCGLMDQMASSVEGLVYIDFKDNEPIVDRLDFDFSKSGYSLCVVDSGASHANLTQLYADITTDMLSVSKIFGKDYLREVDESLFYDNLKEISRRCKARAVLRAMHFFDEQRRVEEQYRSLKDNNFNRFLSLVNDSGASSWQYLQNVIPNEDEQRLAFTLAVCRRFAGDDGAVRVHGGGFAGTALAVVSNERVDGFCENVEKCIGQKVKKLTIKQ